MDAIALLTINSEEEKFLPVDIKVRMLMEQGGMRMRASAMVGRRISQLDDVIRARALLAIVRTEEQRSARTTSTSSHGKPDPGRCRESSSVPAAAPADEYAGSERIPQRSLPSPEDAETFARMAVSALKTVLFQISDEAQEPEAKDVLDVYEGILTTEELSEASDGGFPAVGVDTLMSLEHSRYRRLVAARHRFVLRKLGVLLDMKEDLNTVLDLAVDTEALEDIFADVDLSSPEDGEADRKSSDNDTIARMSAKPDASALVASTPSAKVQAMSALQNTTWDKHEGNDDTTEDETDTETPQQEVVAVVSPSH